MKWSYVIALGVVTTVLVGAILGLALARDELGPGRHVPPAGPSSPTATLDPPAEHTPPPGGWPHG